MWGVMFDIWFGLLVIRYNDLDGIDFGVIKCIWFGVNFDVVLCDNYCVGDILCCKDYMDMYYWVKRFMFSF